MKEFWKEYLTYSRSEKNGISVLFILVILIWIAPLSFDYLFPREKIDHSDFEEQVALLQQSSVNPVDAAPVKEERFPSDTAKKEKKLKRKYQSRSNYSKVTIQINTADSAEWRKLYGIGAVYSARIVKYRELLGGFTKKEQLMEVYGIDDTLYQKIEPHLLVDPIEVKKININLADWKELKEHPYISYKLASNIVNFREHHGNYNSLDDLRKLYLMTDSILEIISPYLNTK